jgi:HTH-type transcriptional regulator/antitoxin HigA
MKIDILDPRDVIREELKERNWMQRDLAEVMGMNESYLSYIMSGKSSITSKTAIKLGSAFGTGAQFWLNLENAYRLSKKER